MNASLPRAGRVEALQSITHSPGRSWEVPVTVVVSSLKSCTDNLKWRECKGPYLNDVYTIFGILDPLTPCLHFGKIHKTKSTQPPLLRLHFVNPPPPLSVDVI